MLQWWMMNRWGYRAWWVVVSWACPWGESPRLVFFPTNTAPLSFSQIVPRVAIAKGNPIRPTWDTLHYCRCCFKATTANIIACTVVTVYWQCLHCYGAALAPLLNKGKAGVDFGWIVYRSFKVSQRAESVKMGNVMVEVTWMKGRQKQISLNLVQTLFLP